MNVFCILSDDRAFRSKSPAMHTHVLRRVGMDGIYVPFMVRPQDLGAAVSGLRALNIAGANVTVPYKQAVMPYLDGIDTEASAIGAVNTIVLAGDRLLGYNTDAGGLVDSLRDVGFSAQGKKAVIVGTGGAAGAAVFALHRLGPAGITVVGRSTTGAEDLAGSVECNWSGLDSFAEVAAHADLIVNATSVSSHAEAPDLARMADSLDMDGCDLVLDLNYGRADNFWKKLAERIDARFMDGLPMLANQARRSFALWTGSEVPVEYFLEALDQIP